MNGTTYTFRIRPVSRLHRELRAALHWKAAFIAIAALRLAEWAIRTGLPWGILPALGALAGIFTIVVDLCRASQLTKVLGTIGGDR